MNRKSLALGMIVPFAAAGAVVTAPSVSAITPSPHHNNQAHNFANTKECLGNSDKLTLRGKITPNHQKIDLTVKLNVIHQRSHQRYTVTVKREGGANFILWNDRVRGHKDFGGPHGMNLGRKTYEDSTGAGNKPNNRPNKPDFFVAKATHHASGKTCTVHLQVGGMRHEVD